MHYQRTFSTKMNPSTKKRREEKKEKCMDTDTQMTNSKTLATSFLGKKIQKTSNSQINGALKTNSDKRAAGPSKKH
jgi:hypothetical protein